MYQLSDKEVLHMKRLLVSLMLSLIVVGFYTGSFAAGAYDKYLTGADIEKISGMSGIKEVPRDPSKGAGGDLNFAGSDDKLVVMAGFQSADYYANYKKQKGYFKSDVKGVGEEAFSGPASLGPEYMLVFRKGSHCITLTSFFNIGGPASKPLVLTQEQLVELGKIVAERL